MICVLCLVVGADCVTLATAAAVTSLLTGILIGALLCHVIPRLRCKKERKCSRSDVYERPELNEASSLSVVERGAEGQYTELQIRNAQPTMTSEEVPLYVNCA